MSTADDHNFEASLASLNAATYQEDLMPISMLGISPVKTGTSWSVKWGEVEGCGNMHITAIRALFSLL